MRPKDVSDLDVMWAIRDIPAFLIDLKQKGILYTLLAIIGNKEYCCYSQPEFAEILGTSVKTLKREIAHLETNFLRVDRSIGRTFRNKYYLEYDLILFCGNRVNLTLLKNKQVKLTSFKEEIRSTWPTGEVNLTLPYKISNKDIHIKQEREESLSPSLFSFDQFEFTERHHKIAKVCGISIDLIFEKFKQHILKKGTNQFKAEDFELWILREMEHATKSKK